MLAAGAYNESVTFPRSSGILLHPTSLPGRFGIGDLGPEAYRFVDFLAAAGQRIWQVLPLGPTGYGDSPYQLSSAFAGNPLLISLDGLAAEGLVSREELGLAPEVPVDEGDYGRVIRFKLPLLRAAYERFKTSWKDRREYGDFGDFRAMSDRWLGDYALFMAVKTAHGGEAVWSRWEPAIAARKPGALKEWRGRLAGENEKLGFPQDGRPTDLRSARQRRRVGESGPVPVRCGGRSGGDVGRAAGLFQRHGPIVGQSHLPLGPHGADWFPLVDRPAVRGAGAGGYRAGGPFPRPGSLLGSAGGRDCGAERTVGEGSRRGAVRSLGRRARQVADCGGKPGRDHAGSGSYAHRVRLSRHGHPAVRIRERPAGARFQAAQLSARPRGIYGHAR